MENNIIGFETHFHIAIAPLPGQVLVPKYIYYTSISIAISIQPFFSANIYLVTQAAKRHLSWHIYRGAASPAPRETTGVCRNRCNGQRSLQKITRQNQHHVKRQKSFTCVLIPRRGLQLVNTQRYVQGQTEALLAGNVSRLFCTKGDVRHAVPIPVHTDQMK